MLQSMTGFVSHEVEIGGYTVVWEVRTLNHRFMDMSVKLPESLRSLEFELRNLAKQSIRRGKMDVSLFLRSKNLNDVLNVAPERINAVAAAVSVASDKFKEYGINYSFELSRLFTDSNFSGQDNNSFTDEFKNSILDSFKDVLAKLVASRVNEGKRLADVLNQCLCQMKQITAEICLYARDTKQKAHTRLKERLAELASNLTLDPIRLEQEVLLIAQKADIQEELDRLHSHYCEITNILDSQEQVGRKLDFMMQELNREANTICSKASDIAIINNAISLKTNIEQMREQIQNIE